MRGERGQAGVELLGALPLLLLVAAAVWQALLVGSAMSSASNAARTGARTVALDDEQVSAAAKASLRDAFREGAEVRRSGETVVVEVKVPILVPGIFNERFTVSEKATIPG